MAINDYILCKICGVKLLYDGAEEGSMTNREWYKERFGKDIEMTCPPCDKLDADIEHTTEPVAWWDTQEGQLIPAVPLSSNRSCFQVPFVPLYAMPAPKREPLSEINMKSLWGDTSELNTQRLIAFARAIEKYHGIGGKDE